jgi:hypothetical protein
VAGNAPSSDTRVPQDRCLLRKTMWMPHTCHQLENKHPTTAMVRLTAWILGHFTQHNICRRGGQVKTEFGTPPHPHITKMPCNKWDTQIFSKQRDIYIFTKWIYISMFTQYMLKILSLFPPKADAPADSCRHPVDGTTQSISWRAVIWENLDKGGFDNSNFILVRK